MNNGNQISHNVRYIRLKNVSVHHVMKIQDYELTNKKEE